MTAALQGPPVTLGNLFLSPEIFAARDDLWIREECKAGSANGQCANGLGWRAVAVRDAITQILLAHLVRPTMTRIDGLPNGGSVPTPLAGALW